MNCLPWAGSQRNLFSKKTKHRDVTGESRGRVGPKGDRDIETINSFECRTSGGDLCSWHLRSRSFDVVLQVDRFGGQKRWHMITRHTQIYFEAWKIFNVGPTKIAPLKIFIQRSISVCFCVIFCFVVWLAVNSVVLIEHHNLRWVWNAMKWWAWGPMWLAFLGKRDSWAQWIEGPQDMMSDLSQPITIAISKHKQLN